MEKNTTFHTVCRLVLLELRQECNVQQAEISQLLGKSPSTWSKVESGDTPLTLDHILTACHAFQVWPSALLATAQDYMELLRQEGWFVATHGQAIPKEEDMLSTEADRYYAQLAEGEIPRSYRRRYPVLQTPWPYANTCEPLDVFDWIIKENPVKFKF